MNWLFESGGQSIRVLEHKKKIESIFISFLLLKLCKPSISHLVSGLNEAQVLDVSLQKEFSEKQK